MCSTQLFSAQVLLCAAAVDAFVEMFRLVLFALQVAGWSIVMRVTKGMNFSLDSVFFKKSRDCKTGMKRCSWPECIMHSKPKPLQRLVISDKLKRYTFCIILHVILAYTESLSIPVLGAELTGIQPIKKDYKYAFLPIDKMSIVFYLILSSLLHI